MATSKYADYSEERKVRERERSRQWRAANPERATEYDRKKSARDSEARRVFRLEHPVVKKTKAERKAHISAYNKKWRLANLERDQKRRAEYYLANMEHRKKIVRNSMYKRIYGLSLADYEAMVVAQNGCCDICGADKPGGKGRWPVDHCSKTGKVRALLCNTCNPGLGFFKHDIQLLQRAIDYLKKF